MADEIVVSGSGFARRWPVGFGIGHVDEREAEPVIRVAAVNLATGDEEWREVHLGEPFEVAGQTWQVEELRHPILVEYEIVLRRVA